MNKPRHTKGPWTCGGELISRAGTSTEIASVWSRRSTRRDAPEAIEADANRALICDAPALIAMLAQCEATLEAHCSYNPKKLRVLLAKHGY